MKTTVFVLLAIVTLTLAISGQKPTKEEKRKIEADKKAAQREWGKNTIDFVQFVKFPSQYLDRDLRLQRVAITDISPYTDGGVTYYAISVANDQERTFAVPVADGPVLFADVGLAQKLVAHIQEMRTGGMWNRDVNPLADVYFKMTQLDTGNRRYFVAGVKCVAVYGFFSKLTYYGNCSG